MRVAFGTASVWWLSLLAGFASAGVAGCASQAQMSARLQSDSPAERVQAMVDAVNANDQSAVPLIVENLGSSEADVRMFAATALVKLTGQTMGYECYAPDPQRQQAIERWRQWLKNGRKALPSTAPASSPQTGPA